MINRLIYWKRIISTYLIQGKSNLSFWHGTPKINNSADYSNLGEYYMEFYSKGDYKGDHDVNGIPQLNYHGDIGLQYNPIAISQWALGNYNLWIKNNNQDNYLKFIKAADWLVDNLKKNSDNIYVWKHKFDWVYKENLINPWHSGLAQGQGLSVLCRAYKETKDSKYYNSLEKVFESFLTDVQDGGVTFTDQSGNLWIEEYIMKKEPTHILNGFIWALWGIYDYWLLTSNKDIKILFDKYSKTIKDNIDRYDIGYWSLYELSNLNINMRASIFYHKLHIVQLTILSTMTKDKIFAHRSNYWSEYLNSRLNIIRATIMKIFFKICYY